MTKVKKENSAADFLPKQLTLPALKKAAKKCQGCHLYKNATQTVFGEGSSHAKLMIVGEIPGDKEDQHGEPFVGPAGALLQEALERAGISLKNVYITNVVKHFKFTFINHRRLHRSPVSAEIKACIPWLNSEIQAVKPKLIVCLGLIAAKSLINKSFTIREQRGKWFKHSKDIYLMATFHPSAILRAPDEDERHRLKKLFYQDIQKAVAFLKKHP